jgi:CO/xanthine dehydrogenase Mo-binding subunit
MDPFALREKNGFRPGSVTATGQRLNDSVGLLETMTKVRQEIERIGTPAATGTRKYGWGVASMFYGIGVPARPNPGRARIDVDEAGKFTLSVGIGDVGQGSSTILTQIAAEVLRRPVADIGLVAGDTDVCPDSGVTAASRVTYVVGRAVQTAAENLLGRLRSAAAGLLAAVPETVRYDPEGFHLPADRPRYVTVSQAVRKLREQGEAPCGEGEFDPGMKALDPKTSQGKPTETYAFATQGALVAVDEGTGQVEVLTVVACHDVGRAINPASVAGQIEGAVSMGLGFGLLEEIVLEGGRMRNPGFKQYFLPTALDMPQIVSLIAEAPEATGPFGAKGVGEPALVPTAPAIVNAIHAATGIRVTELPVTSERLWGLLRRGPEQ